MKCKAEFLKPETVEMMVTEYDPGEGHTPEQLYLNLRMMAASHELLRAKLMRALTVVQEAGKLARRENECDLDLSDAWRAYVDSIGNPYGKFDLWLEWYRAECLRTGVPDLSRIDREPLLEAFKNGETPADALSEELSNWTE